MPRKKKQEVKVNNVESFEGLLQEAYNDACLNIMDAQESMNKMVSGAEPADVDDITKIAKEEGNLLKIKDSAIKLKLEIAKILQSDMTKSKMGDEDSKTGVSPSISDFKAIRELLKRDKEEDAKTGD